MDQQVAIIRQNPFRLAVSFHTDRKLARLALQLKIDLVGDGLYLALVRARADHKIIGEGRDARQVEHFDIGRFFRFSGPDGDQPCRNAGFDGGRFLKFSLGQKVLLSVSYYNREIQTNSLW
jgi:hypothetical protein